MTNYDKIYSIAEDCEGYITNKEAEKNGIKRSQLASLANNKAIERVGSGIYKLPNYPIDNLYILSKVSKNMCYSHATALYLHNLIDRISYAERFRIYRLIISIHFRKETL